LHAAAVHFHDAQLGGCHAGWWVFALRQGASQVGGHVGVTFGVTLFANLPGQAFNLFGGNVDLGKDLHVLTATVKRGGIAAGVDDLLEQTRAVLAQVNAQAR
jgi:hypothetical protein